MPRMPRLPFAALVLGAGLAACSAAGDEVTAPWWIYNNTGQKVWIYMSDSNWQTLGNCFSGNLNPGEARAFHGVFHSWPKGPTCGNHTASSGGGPQSAIVMHADHNLPYVCPGDKFHNIQIYIGQTLYVGSCSVQNGPCASCGSAAAPAASEAAAAAPAPGASLFQRLGGSDAVNSMADDFVERIRSDPGLVRLLGGATTADAARQAIRSELCARSGGPCPRSADALVIAPADWEATRGHLLATLDKFKVAPREGAEVVSLVAGLRRQ